MEGRSRGDDPCVARGFRGSRSARAVVGDLDGTEYGLALRNGAELFAAATSGALQASAAVAAGTLYLASGGTLYAYAPR